MQLSHGPENHLSVTGKNWELHFGEPFPARFSVVCDDLSVIAENAVLNELSEESALPSKIRPHVSEDEREYSFESKSSIPFGSEPEVLRKYKLTEGVMQLTTDLVMRAAPGMTRVFAGDLLVTGKIASVSILMPDGTFQQAEGDCLYDAECPPLSILFRSETGALLELSAGEDVWRCCAASKAGGKSRFTVEHCPGGIRFHRELFQWVSAPDTDPPPGRTWRFNTILSWLPAGARHPGIPSRAIVFDCSSFDWPDTLRKPDGTVCFSANGTINILKRWIRTQLAGLKKGDVLVLDQVAPGPCDNASHQDRPGKGTLLHWDLRGILELRRWAEKQLAPSGAVLRIELAKNHPLRKLPSLTSR